MSNVYSLTTEKFATNDDLKRVARKFVIRLRWNIRRHLEQQHDATSRIKSLQAFVQKLETTGTPFDSDRISRAKAEIQELELIRSAKYKAIKDCGRALAEIAPFIDHALTMQERCNLLNINVADRAGLTEDDGIVHLIHIHHLEDSAEHRGEDFATGPLHWALTEFFVDWLCNTKEGKKVTDEHLWGPGGMFEFLPTYTRQADGTFARNPPPLRLA